MALLASPVPPKGRLSCSLKESRRPAPPAPGRAHGPSPWSSGAPQKTENESLQAALRLRPWASPHHLPGFLLIQQPQSHPYSRGEERNSPSGSWGDAGGGGDEESAAILDPPPCPKQENSFNLCRFQTLFTVLWNKHKFLECKKYDASPEPWTLREELVPTGWKRFWKDGHSSAALQTTLWTPSFITVNLTL